jgi:hypothetical protein
VRWTLGLRLIAIRHVRRKYTSSWSAMSLTELSARSFRTSVRYVISSNLFLMNSSDWIFPKKTGTLRM